MKNSFKISSFALPLRSLKYSKKLNLLKSLSTARFFYRCLLLRRYESLVRQNWSIFDRMIDRGRDGGDAWNENTAWCVWGLHYWHTCYSRRHGRRARLVYVVARMYIPGLNVTPVIPNSVYCLYLSSVGWLHFHSYNTFGKLRFRLG